MKTELFLRSAELETSFNGLALVVSKASISFVDGGKTVLSRELTVPCTLKVGALEALMFTSTVLRENDNINLLVLESMNMAFIASYFLKEVGYPYHISTNERLPAASWCLAYNAEDFRDDGQTVKNAYLPLDYCVKDIDSKALNFNSSGDINIAIVAYYAAPFVAVGAKRPEFMRQYFDAKDGVSCEIISTIKSRDDKHVYVPDYPYDSFNQIKDQDILELLDAEVSVIGASWSKQLQRHFDLLDSKDQLPEIVIFTGNPFYYFGIAEYIKNAFGLLVVLDYRDPFVNNPLMVRTKEVKDIQAKMEERFNRNADLIAVVNRPCLELLEGDDIQSKAIIVENGFDENAYSSNQYKADIAREKGSVQYVYAGSFSKFRNGDIFAKALKSTEDEMIYMGSDPSFGLDNPQINSLGMVSGNVAANEIMNSDVGVVFATGESFESTTKIYDYIGADIPILIVTSGAIKTGAIHDLTSELDGVYWVENDEHKIIEFLNNFEFKTVARSEKNYFSRGYHSQKFLDKILELNNEKN